MRRFGLILMCLLIAACSTPQGVGPIAEPERGTATSNTAEVVGGDEQALREFIARYIGPSFSLSPGGSTQIMIEGIPDNLDPEVTIPDGSRIIGSITRESPEDKEVEIILDMDLSAEEVISFYDHDLIQKGWRNTHEAPPRGFGSQSRSWGAFCYGEEDAVLQVWARETPGGITEVRVNIQTPDRWQLCRGLARHSDPVQEMMPLLLAPVETFIHSGSSGTGVGEGYIAATMTTTLSVRELAAHYDEQFEEAGWIMLGREHAEGGGDSVAWSSWLRTDEHNDEWSGVLWVFESPSAADRRFAWFQIERIP